MAPVTHLAHWLLFQTPTIKGDDGAFLIAALFLTVGFGALGLWLLAWLLTGSTELPMDPNYGRPKHEQEG